jgi:23S rRNA (cytidine1920-2'-O)/16S rRNA (cytidine1409-2'-O)-methyltransferase
LSGKERVDTALVRRGLAQSREKAQAMIMAGEVYIGERKINKSSETVKPDEELTIRGETDKFVSRGAHKLEKAVRVFNADLDGRVVMDIGASTGGFTDICLRNGAKHVYSIDVGYGQLDWKLRNDSRVTVMERTNARYLTPDLFEERPEIAVMDVSFISVRLIIPAAFTVMGEKGKMITLLKPQFEAGREKIGKNGVVRDALTHEEVLNGIVEFAESAGLHVYRLDYSPITGPEGNIEFLAEIAPKHGTVCMIAREEVHKIVGEAHRVLLHVPGQAE